MQFKESIVPIATGRELRHLIEQNDQVAFTAFYSEYFQKLILVADKYVKDSPIAEGIVQNVFLKIWEDKDLLLSINSLRAYLYRSVINAALNFVNRKRNIERHHIIIAEHISHNDIDALDQQNELIVLLYNEIDLLPEKCQKVFKLCRLEGLKYKDIAIELGISEKTVENHMSNALRILRLRMLQHADSDPSFKKIKYFSLFNLFLY